MFVPDGIVVLSDYISYMFADRVRPEHTKHKTVQYLIEMFHFAMLVLCAHIHCALSHLIILQNCFWNTSILHTYSVDPIYKYVHGTDKGYYIYLRMRIFLLI